MAKVYQKTTSGGRFAALILGILFGLFTWARLDAGHAGELEAWTALLSLAGFVGFGTFWQRIR